ncbi:MAG: AAA family ATPase [Sphingomonadales bacterium]|nr:AAA family ATPase [Sphingomonadales bacterium]
MREADFRAWLDKRIWKGTPLSDKAKYSRIRRSIRVERGLGGLGFAQATLEGVFEAGAWDTLLSRLVDLRDNPAADPAAVKSVVPQAHNPAGQLGNLLATVTQYGYFLEGREPNYGEGNDTSEDQDEDQLLTAESVDATLKAYDENPSAFMQKHGFASNFDYVVFRPGAEARYPAKAIFLVAYSSIPGNPDITVKGQRDTFGDAEGGPIHLEFVRLGYGIESRRRPNGGVIELTREAVLAAMDRFDELGEDGYRKLPGHEAFGDAQSWFVFREEFGTGYPLKLIYGTAFQFLPGGTIRQPSTTANGVGFTPRAVEGILRRLGFRTENIKEKHQLLGSRAASKSEDEMARMNQPTNLILYGPPGTGKTYRTALEAVKLCDGIASCPETKDGRAALMARYNDLVADKRIAFVTFHQSYGYEDFVEGLRPVPIGNSDGESVGFHLQPQPGIFRLIAERAETGGLAVGSEPLNIADRAVYKMSLGEVADSASDFVFTESLHNNYALFGFRNIDWTEPRFSDREEIFSEVKKRFPDEDVTPNKGMVQSPDVFRNQLEIGDMLIVAKGNHRFRAIGIVEGEYEYAPRPDGRYCHRRKVRWLWHDKDGLDVSELYPPKFIQKTLYRLKDAELNRPLIARLVSETVGDGAEGEPLPHVLVIDEINRANVSKVFGELITLLEPDKRTGMDNALSVTLPYSKRQFSVPANLHIIGTMNTADRSIALLDTALRRRFDFREMAPDPSLLAKASERAGIDLVRVLTTINQRIEYLIDREHRIGHAFFIGCETAEQVHAAMRDKVIPLLQEYFFEDWSRIHGVLGDGFIGSVTLKCPLGEGEDRKSWFVRLQKQPDGSDRFPHDAFAQLIGKVAGVAAESQG